MLLPSMIVKAAAAVVVATLGASSASNMYQMQRTFMTIHRNDQYNNHNHQKNNHNHNHDDGLGKNGSIHTIDAIPTTITTTASKTRTTTTTTTTTQSRPRGNNDVMKTKRIKDDHHDQLLLIELKQMKRHELLHLFLTTCPNNNNNNNIMSSSYEEFFVHGDWNGVLLDNNSWIMTKVTAFITHQLFGRGRVWNGKVFMEQGFGMNRFQSRTSTSSTTTTSTTTTTTAMAFQHGFDYSVGAPSVLDGKPCISLDYHKHQSSSLSPWTSMKDELRHISPNILLGIGYMGWSGGKWNASPFCLLRVNDNTTTTTTTTTTTDGVDTTDKLTPTDDL